MQESQQPPKQKPVVNKNNLQQMTVLKRAKLAHYPYYPVTHTLSQNGLNYVFNLDYMGDYYNISVTPIRQNKQRKQFNQLNNTYIQLDSLPRKNINFLYVLAYDDYENVNGKAVTVTLLDFVLGFSAGFLIRCKYTNARKQGQGQGRRQLQITGKYNKKPDYRESLMMKMSSTFFGNEDFYKVAVQKPVRNFQCYNIPKKMKKSSQKYNYTYLIGNHLYLSTQFDAQSEAEVLKTFYEVKWHQMPLQTMAKLHRHNSIVINSSRHKTLMVANSMLIEWADQISTYVYTPSNQLIVADNQENRILIFDVLDHLRIKCVYNFDLDIKKFSYFPSPLGNDDIFLLIMPYDSNLFVLNLNKNVIISLYGHRSYITQSSITQSGYIITGGCDHRIGLKNLSNVKQWTNIKPNKEMGSQSGSGVRKFQIQTSKVVTSKFSQIYFLGQFNNVNSERNNNTGFGLGNFLYFGPGSQLYAFLSYDFLVKIYRIIV